MSRTDCHFCSEAYDLCAQNIEALEAQHQPRLATPFFHIPEETVAAAQQQKEASFAFGAASMPQYKHPQEDPHHRFMR